MICDVCELNFTDKCTDKLRRVDSVPDKNGFVIIALKCDDAIIKKGE
jgi:hypothetical protein